jgi:hypothetical protein
MSFAALLGTAAAGAKTFHQPCGQRNERIAPRAGADSVAVFGRRLARFYSAGALLIFAATTGAGARRSRKPLMRHIKDEGAKRGRGSKAKKNERPGPEGAGPGPF